MNVDCFDSYNASSPFFTDTSADNAADRQWYWMTCNEPFFYWQTYVSPFCGDKRRYQRLQRSLLQRSDMFITVVHRRASHQSSRDS
jgi:hypothetical protein